MTRLLVSVRDAVEAQTALEAGADLIDFKEPLRGSLASVEPDVLRDSLTVLAGQVPTSAALGELRELDLAQVRALPENLTFAKIGLADCASSLTWRAAWAEALATLPPSITPVAVIYADFAAADAPEPAQIFDTAQQLGCRALLVDTFHKNGRSLVRQWTLDQIERTIAAAREAEMLSVLGGSLDFAAIETLLPLEPDYIAVRAAVTSGTRSAALDGRRVAQLVERLRRQTAPQH